MGISFSVQVLDASGDPAASVKVRARFPSFPAGEVSLEEFTDSSGQASFETAGSHHKTVKLSARGEHFGPYDLDEGADYTINLS